jgi:hypothetical protein
MSPLLALTILSWIAIVVLYLGLAAVQREVRMLRRQLTERRTTTGDGLDDLRLPQAFLSRIVLPGRSRTVLVADSGCPLCRAAATVLAEPTGQDVLPVLLTYESPEEWADLSDTLQIVRDRDAWSALAHLSPPVLLEVNHQGRIESLVLPVTELDVTRAVGTTPSSRVSASADGSAQPEGPLR